MAEGWPTSTSASVDGRPGEQVQRNRAEFGRPRPVPTSAVSEARRESEREDDSPDPPRLPGLADSVPFLLVGAVLLAYGIWIALVRPSTSIGRFPLEFPVLAVGAMLLIGGVLGAFLEEEDSGGRIDKENEGDVLSVPRQEWFEMKNELSALKRRAYPGASATEPPAWDEGAEDVPPRRLPGGVNRDFSSAPNAGDEIASTLEELDEIARDITPEPNARSRPVNPE